LVLKEEEIMTTMKEAAQNFLSLKTIAVAGVSRTKGSAANAIYRKLRLCGYQVFAVNPNSETVEGDRSYTNLKSISEKPEGVVIVTKPEVTDEIVRECEELGIKNVWMHNGMGTSVSENAVSFCREKGINVIPGGCPMMYVENSDVGHRFIRWFQEITGKIPGDI
jgi:predicted CoA-binding protein